MAHAALLFSGGVDSTLAAVLMLERFDHLHLLTWDTGGGLVGLGWSRASAQALADRYPGRIQHHIAECREIFSRLVLSRLWDDYRRYRSRFVFCLGCKLSMHVATLRFCKAHHLTDAADGSSRETPYYVEQMQVSLDWIAAFYQRHGVAFHTPVAHLENRDEKRALLDSYKLPRGRSLLGRNPGTQPFCLPGNLIYAMSTTMKIHPRFDPAQVARFLDDHREELDRLVDPESDILL